MTLDRETPWRALEVPLLRPPALCADLRSLCPTGACGHMESRRGQAAVVRETNSPPAACVCIDVAASQDGIIAAKRIDMSKKGVETCGDVDEVRLPLPSARESTGCDDGIGLDVVQGFHGKALGIVSHVACRCCCHQQALGALKTCKVSRRARRACAPGPALTLTGWPHRHMLRCVYVCLQECAIEW